jgi:selenocysteine lyase/cysteine desulfurase
LKITGTSNISEKKAELMKRLIQGLRDVGAKIYWPNCHTSVLSFNVPGYQADEIGLILSEDYDIAVRTGYHCAPFVHDLIETKEAQGTVRVSLGFFNTVDDVDALVHAVAEIIGE